MKILFLAKGLNIGGIETNLVLLARELGARGHEVVVASSGGRLLEDVLATGASHVPLRMEPRDPRAVLDDVRTLRRTIAAAPPDIIHVFSHASAVLLWMALRFPPSRRFLPSALPVVSSVMGLHRWPEESMWLVRARVYLTSLGARRFIVIAPAIGDIVRRLPIRRSRVVERSVVGLTLPDRSQLEGDVAGAVRTELGVGPGESVIMTIGGLEPRKSHELFLQAAAQVLADRQDVRFFVVGEGSLRSRLQREIEDLGIGSHASLLGERTDLEHLLAVTDVYVRPGVVEGFIGITVLHAQTLGVPVISFETDDVKLAITAGETGLLVPGGDVAALARTMNLLLDDPELSRRIGVAGQRHVEQHFSLPVVVDGLEALYKEEVGAGPRR